MIEGDNKVLMGSIRAHTLPTRMHTDVCMYICIVCVCLHEYITGSFMN